VAYTPRARILCALLFAAPLFAACSSGSPGPGVASAGTSPSTTTATATGLHGSPLAFSQCMRAHGVTDFPDPDSSGRIAIQGGPGSDLAPHNPTFQAAQKACQSLQPKESPADQQKNLQNALKFSQCMRAHGVKDFPDPVQNGQGVGIRINGGQGTDLNPNNSTFQAAQKACQSIIGAPGGNLSTNASGGSGSATGGVGK
jgi:hypothetical protein